VIADVLAEAIFAGHSRSDAISLKIKKSLRHSDNSHSISMRHVRFRSAKKSRLIGRHGPFHF
jgi:hypothetical protein